jgi:hypothetical protein
MCLNAKGFGENKNGGVFILRNGASAGDENPTKSGNSFDEPPIAAYG